MLKSSGGFVWGCKNYDGDVQSDVIAQGLLQISRVWCKYPGCGAIIQGVVQLSRGVVQLSRGVVQLSRVWCNYPGYMGVMDTIHCM